MKKNKNISYGDNSTNIGQADSIEIKYESNSDVQISDYKKRKIAEISIKPKRVTVIGILGVGATLLTYIGLFVKFPIFEQPKISSYLPFIIILFILILRVVHILSRRKFIPLFKNYSIETDYQKIYLKKLTIKCPICKSKMSVFQNQAGVFISCKRNPEQHIYKFDYTTFEDTE